MTLRPSLTIWHSQHLWHLNILNAPHRGFVTSSFQRAASATAALLGRGMYCVELHDPVTQLCLGSPPFSPQPLHPPKFLCLLDSLLPPQAASVGFFPDSLRFAWLYSRPESPSPRLVSHSCRDGLRWIPFDSKSLPDGQHDLRSKRSLRSTEPSISLSP